MGAYKVLLVCQMMLSLEYTQKSVFNVHGRCGLWVKTKDGFLIHNLHTIICCMLRPAHNVHNTHPHLTENDTLQSQQN